MKTVYIIEDEAILRDLLNTFFVNTFPEIIVLGSSGDGAEAMRDCIRLRPDLAIIDIQLPGVNGLEILHFLKREFPSTKILLFTGRASPQSVKIAMLGEVDGFVTKLSGLEELENAIRACGRGERYFSPEIEEALARSRERNP